MLTSPQAFEIVARDISGQLCDEGLLVLNPGERSIAAAGFGSTQVVASGAGVALADEIAYAADQLSDFLSEALAAGGHSNWPPCPWHPHTHPLQSCRVGERAVWRCPRTRSAVCDVGQLASIRRS